MQSAFLYPLGVIAAFGLAACVATQTAEPIPTGAQDFADYCAGCHGSKGLGDGPDAEGLATKPANLTQLTAKNGGHFPATGTMAQIWGYTGGKGNRVMPEFAPLLDGEVVPYDGGDGILTPTPIRLVQLSEYVKSLQAK